MHPIAARIAERRLATLDLWRTHFPEVFVALKRVGETAIWISETADEARMSYRMPKDPKNNVGMEKLADMLESLAELATEVQKARQLAANLHQVLVRADPSARAGQPT